MDASIRAKNRAGDRDLEMRQTKKGNEWHFGMKVHIGADAGTGVVHSVTTTPANVQSTLGGVPSRSPATQDGERTPQAMQCWCTRS